MLAAAACSSTLTVSDVRRLDQRDDVDGLVEGWRAGQPVSVAPSLLDALARHPDDPRARGAVVVAARGHSSEAVRRHAVSVLPRLEHESADGALVDALGDPFPSVRGAARRALVERGAPVFDRLVAAARSHGNPLVRASSLDLVAQAGLREPARRPAASSALTDRARRDDAPAVRAAAAAGLGKHNVTEARSVLRTLAKTDDDRTVRSAAGAALAKLDAPATDELKVVAVLPLKNDTGDRALDGYGEQVADLLASALSAAGVCEVVDQARRDAALAELRKTGSLLYDGDRPNAPQLGKFALADQLVYGAVQRTGAIYTVVVNRMDVSTLALVGGASVSVRGYRADLDRLKVEVTRKFVDRFQ